MSDEPVRGCGYQGYEFGAVGYPDSVCIEGRLYDADHCDDDGRLYETDEDVPCPMCRPRDAEKWWAKRKIMDGCGSVSKAKSAARSLVATIRQNRITTPEE
jgi:hypothetical protein